MNITAPRDRRVAFAPPRRLHKPGTVGVTSLGAEMRFIAMTAGAAARRARGGRFVLAGYPDFTYHNEPEKRPEPNARVVTPATSVISMRTATSSSATESTTSRFGRRQHLSGRDRGRAACRPGVRDAPCSACLTRNWARRSWRRRSEPGCRSTSPSSAPARDRSPATRCRSRSKSGGLPREDSGKSSSACWATPTGSGRAEDLGGVVKSAHRTPHGGAALLRAPSNHGGHRRAWSPFADAARDAAPQDEV